jgi:hypothetical protein
MLAMHECKTKKHKKDLIIAINGKEIIISAGAAGVGNHTCQ